MQTATSRRTRNLALTVDSDVSPSVIFSYKRDQLWRSALCLFIPLGGWFRVVTGRPNRIKGSIQVVT